MSTVITPTPDFVFITLAEAKMQLRIEEDYTAEDAKILGAIDAAVNAAENYLDRGQGIITAQTMVITAATFMAAGFYWWGKYEVAEVSVLLEGEAERTVLPAEAYMVIPCLGYGWRLYVPGNYVLQDVSNAVIITVNCTVPPVVKQACMLWIGDFYEYREDRAEVDNRASKALLRHYRKF